MGAPGGSSGTGRDAAAIGGIVSSWFLGFAIGAVLVGTYCDHIGRLRTIFIGTLFAAAGAGVQAGSNSIAVIIVGRVINGIG